MINQASATCPVTPLEIRSGPLGPYQERDGWTVRLREPTGPWRAGQSRTLTWLPAVYYSSSTFEVLAERLDGAASVQLSLASIEGPGYRSELTLPTPGCWRLTARLAEDRGSVVVPVEP